MGALDRLRALVRPPAPSPGPSGLVILKLTRKHVVDGGAVYNAGEIAGFTPVQAAALLREGAARPCGPTAVSQVRPREDDTREFHLAARPATDESTWSAPSGDLGETMWPR